MRFYTRQHRYYCGIDLHARSMYVCVLDQQGNILVHRNMLCGADAFLNVVAPYRENLAVAVECIFTLSQFGKKIAYEANRQGVAEHFPNSSVRKSIELDSHPAPLKFCPRCRRSGTECFAPYLNPESNRRVPPREMRRDIPKVLSHTFDWDSTRARMYF